MNTTRDQEATQFQYEEIEDTTLNNENTNQHSNVDSESTASENEITATTTQDNSGWKRIVIGGVTGIMLGAAATFLMGMGKAEDSSDEEQHQEQDPKNPENPVTPSWSDGEITVATKVTDDMSFGKAFAAARTEVGSGGAFEWRGNVYSTYTAEEWDTMSPQQRNEYEDHFSWNHHATTTGTHHASTNSTDTHHNTAHHTTKDPYNTDQRSANTTNETQNSGRYTAGHTVPEQMDDDDLDVVSIERTEPSVGEERGYTPPQDIDIAQAEIVGIENPDIDDSDIEVIGVVYNPEIDMTFGAINIGGHEAVLIDLDNDMTFDKIIVDINDDGIPQPEEIIDIQSIGLTVGELNEDVIYPMPDDSVDPEYTAEL